MFCSECGNEMKETREAVKEEFKGQEFEIRGIRHYACDACGETSFDADASTSCIRGSMKTKSFARLAE